MVLLSRRGTTSRGTLYTTRSGAVHALGLNQSWVLRVPVVLKLFVLSGTSIEAGVLLVDMISDGSLLPAGVLVGTRMFSDGSSSTVGGSKESVGDLPNQWAPMDIIGQHTAHGSLPVGCGPTTLLCVSGCSVASRSSFI